jgi:hypothetical protein
MPLMPAFRRRKKDAGAVGRLITGYGELELCLSKCVGVALALKRNPPAESQKRYMHRIRYENFAIKLVFRMRRGEKKRIDDCAKIMRPVFTRLGLTSQFDEAVNAMRACLRIRNLFAHCTWTQSKKRGLFFINLEEVARVPRKLDLNHFRHASAKTLTDLEDYFVHTQMLLELLAETFAVKTQLMIGQIPLRPRKKPEPSPDTKLFPYKNPY